MEALSINLLSFLACGFLSGLLIGAVGIGGVILVPLLTFTLGVDIYQSIAASIFCFCSFGSCWHFYLCKTKSNFVERYKIYLDWRSTIDTVWRNIAFECKQRTINSTDCFFSTWLCHKEFLKQQNKSHDCAIVISRSKLIFIGAFTGFFSALSGTGGPLILIPLMLWSSVPITIAIGLAQSIQLPISVFATIGNSWSGILNLSVAIPLATGIAFGTYYGGIWIRGVSTSKIKKAWRLFWLQLE